MLDVGCWVRIAEQTLEGSVYAERRILPSLLFYTKGVEGCGRGRLIICSLGEIGGRSGKMECQSMVIRLHNMSKPR